MEPAPPFLVALLVQGIIGGVDIILNHELIARLPSMPAAASEQRLHSTRELVFAVVFFGLAWFRWHGVFALLIVGLFLAELCISTIDTVLELAMRLLPVTERVMHVMLFVNLGIVIALLAPVLLEWMLLPAQMVPVNYGWASWVMSALSAAALGWSVRDARSVTRLKRAGGI